MLLNKRLQNCHRLFHNLGTFHHLRKEHLALGKQLSHLIHTLHKRTLNNLYRRPVACKGLRHILRKIPGNAFNQRVLKFLLQRAVAPLHHFCLRCSALPCSSLLGSNLRSLYLLCQLNKCLRCICIPFGIISQQSNVIQHHCLNPFKKQRLNIIINLQHSRVHNCHIKACSNCVV